MPIKLCPTRYSNNKLLCSHIDTVDLPRGQSVSGNVQNHQKGPSTKVQLYSGSLTRLPRFTHCCSLGCFAQCLWHDGVVLAGRANMENSGQEKVTRCGGIRFNHKGAKFHLSCCILGVLLCWTKVLVHIWKRKGWSFRWEKQVLVGLFRAVVCFQVGLRGCQRKNERRQRRHKRHILLQRRRPLSAVCFFFDIMDQLAQQRFVKPYFVGAFLTTNRCAAYAADEPKASILSFTRMWASSSNQLRTLFVQKSLLGLPYAVALVFHLGLELNAWPCAAWHNAPLLAWCGGSSRICTVPASCCGACVQIEWGMRNTNESVLVFSAFHLRYTSPVGHKDDPLLWALSTWS